MGISPNGPFYILISNFSDREVRLQKKVNIARTAEHPNLMHAIDTDDIEASPMRTLEASINLKFEAPDGKVNSSFSKKDGTAVHYKAADSRDSEISRHTALNKACL